MKICVDCDNKEEFDELVKQLREEGINYQTRILERHTNWLSGDEWPDKESPETVLYDYSVLFWYDGRLI